VQKGKKMSKTPFSNKDVKQSILIVDDEPMNIDVLSGVLRSEYKVRAALNGKRALAIAMANPMPDMIMLDIMMPDIDGYEVCRQIKANPVTKNIPVIFVTAKNQDEDEKKGLELGAVDYITKPINPALVLARVHTHLALYDQNRELERMVRERTDELHHTRLEIILRLGRAAEYKDNETGMHVMRMSHYSQVLALAAGLNEEDAELLLDASPMHDIGKIGIPDNILRKPGKLDENEWDTMQQHPEIGGEIIGTHKSKLLDMARDIALTHHEKFNGKGYPKGLKGEEIPFVSRIVSIADVFDALTTERPYKKAWSVEDALKLIQDEAGKSFDPQLVELFIGVMPEILALKEKYAEKRGQV
jgi:putative two-component system response regulator